MTSLTLAQLLQNAAGQMEAAGLYFGHGTGNAFDEACWMAMHVLDLPPDFDSSLFERVVEPPDRARFEQLLAQRIETRKPLAYLIGEAWFAGLKFEVNESVLVPRSPLAELIVDGFDPWLGEGRLKRAVDVGTGSGCIAIALAYHRGVAVDAVDVSRQALNVAARNVQSHNLGSRVSLYQSDLLEAVKGQRYDLILANPPYVPEASMKTLPPEYGWEPELGLVAGADGLDLVRRLIAQAADVLEPHGVLICEVGEAAEAVEHWLSDLAVTWLDFANGGDGVFLLDRAMCCQVAARSTGR
ncbi:MAG: 50S ribosomal protein L3 N(5)-glutamine methyltransferase [Wenzhouxiangella sp.]|jgi:ribosomal protein L3 glutamine methyltransferase|nr:50S ribosomal protein L3 N(5)-glutamine methyltransferase [Wenzhouxiangella sp.]